MSSVLDQLQTRTQKVAFVALLLLYTVMVTVAMISLASQIGRPTPGFVVWENLVVPAISMRQPAPVSADIPLRSVLRTVDGQSISTAHALRALVAAPPLGTAITYGFDDDGTYKTVAVPTRKLRWRDVMPFSVPYLLTGVSFFAAALIVFYFKPMLPAARAFLALATAIGANLVLALDAFSSFYLQRLCFTADSFVPAAMVHFALCFPEQKRMVRDHPSLLRVAYLLCLPAAVLQNIFLAGAPAAHLRVSNVVYAADVAAAVIVVASVAHTYLRSASALARQQALVVAAGVAIAALVPAVGILSVLVFGTELPFNPLTLFLVICPLTIGYAIARHNLFEVDRFLRTGVVYGALSVLVFASYAALVIGFESWLGASGRPPPLVIPLYLLLVLVFFDPLRARIQTVVDRLFYRQAYNYRATIESTSRALAAFLDTDRIATTVLDALTGDMTIEWGVLIVLADSGMAQRVYARPTDRAEPAAALFPEGDAMLAAVAAGTFVSRYDWEGGETARTALQERLDRLGTVLAFPIAFERKPVAVLLLGEKKSGARYSDEDITLIETLVNQSALALTNAQAYEIIRRTQADLVRAERLAAVGELAAAVAHGIRNPLAGIRAAAQFAREEVDSRHPLTENLDDIIGEADRLEHRVRSLLDFTKPFEPKMEWGDVNRTVQAFATALRRRLPESVHVDVDLAPDVPRVRFDPVQLHEVLEAIAVNGVEAMHSKGALTIRSRVEHNGTGPEVRIAVTDTGPGIDPVQQERIFDLFFTTKSTGTGIGLATVKRLMERQGGRVVLDSAPGKGTTFSVILPIPAAVTANE